MGRFAQAERAGRSICVTRRYQGGRPGRVGGLVGCGSCAGEVQARRPRASVASVRAPSGGREPAENVVSGAVPPRRAERG